MIVLVMIAFVVIVIVALQQFTRRATIKIKAPGLSLDVDAVDNPGVRLSHAKTSTGRIDAVDNTGRGADVAHVRAHGDITATSSMPATGAHSPKL
jgi:hypothetical protein